jgi:outer membrane protein insertion porin family
MNRIAALLLPALLAVSAVQAQGTEFEPFTVTDIRVDGLQRISTGTVFTYLPIERGDRVDRLRAANAIRALFRTGFFNDVRLDHQDGILIVTVRERPAINSVNLVGNKDIQTEELMRGLRDIGLAEGETFDRLQLERITQELTRQYNNRGKYNVAVDPNVSELDRNRVDVTIAIKEGKAARIRHINIVGNQVFDDEDIRSNWESNESNWLSWYRRDDQYSREKLSGDLEKLSSYYLDRGYIDFNIESTQVSITPDSRDMFLVANIREGEVYTVDEVSISGETIVPTEELERLLLVRKDAVFSRRLLELTSDAMTSVLSNVGYAFAEVTPLPTVDRENRRVSINFFVEPGQRVYVRRIEFRGNTRTADEVIRRELRQFEGMWYSQAAIDRSKIRLQRLGYFEDINIETPAVAGTADQVDVVISMKERQSGQFMFGFGYSQVQGLLTTVSVSQNNFLGTGNRVSATVQNNRFVRRFDFTYLDPYFTDDGMSLGYNVMYRELDSGNRNVANFTSDNGALQAVLGVPLTETDSVGLIFGIDRNQIRLFDGRCPPESQPTPINPDNRVPGVLYCNPGEVPVLSPQPFIDYLDALDSRTFNAWRAELSWARDSRNAYFNPTRGTFQRLSAEVALPGSTAEYYKLNYQFARYWPLSRAVVLMTAGEIGYGDSYGKKASRDIPLMRPDPTAEDPLRQVPVTDDDGNPLFRTVTAEGLPFFENFYAGGVRSIRGFEDNTLGPRIAVPYSDRLQPLGGSLLTTGTLELIFPTLLDTNTARVSAFLDFGNVFASTRDFDVGEFRASVGIALQWQAPVGPIVLNLSMPVKKGDDDEIERLQFTFGTQF